MINESFIRDVADKTDIVEVIRKYLPLKKQGRNFFACCPFHGEDTPSFSVSPKKGFYHCFGCGASGDAISFLMEHNEVTFHEAVSELAEAAGLPMPEDFDQEEAERLAQARRQKKALSQYNEKASEFYQSCLKEERGALAAAYLQERGIKPETAEIFGLGYAPEDFNHLAEVFSPYPDENLISGGLVKRNEEKKNIYDVFRHRLIFPIRNNLGLTIGFGGRTLPEETPTYTPAKYLNTAETDIFHKREVLYGLWENKQEIRRQGVVYIAEGYLDVLALTQNGLPSVAVMGTAFQGNQFDLLSTYCRRFVFVFDGDAAGRKAAFEALKTSLSKLSGGTSVSFCLLPEGEDAADVLLKHSDSKSYAAYLEEHTLSLGDYFIAHLQKRHNTETQDGKSALIHEAKFLLRELKDKVLTELLTVRLAQITSSSGVTVKNALGKSRYRRNWRENLEAASQQPPSKVGMIERVLLSCLCNPEAFLKLDISELEMIEQTAPEIGILFGLKFRLENLPADVACKRREVFAYWEDKEPLWYESLRPYLPRVNPNIYRMDAVQLENVYGQWIESQKKNNIHQMIEQLKEKLKDGSITDAEKERLLTLIGMT